ncbi:unnamed protein product [Owenia fusiformis]|uniref:Uncharacterized protein n=1 Tax=Owenia fusiformis TaxID=6347 RepID=A0A8J1U872_OWEFU|nr:unnamed protein product [Owenia fusiformis]CAH1790811.1 unnamed protein product [Owenia fusiformis]
MSEEKKFSNKGLTFQLYLRGNEVRKNEVLRKMRFLKEKSLSKKLSNNTDVIEEALDFWIKNHSRETETAQPASQLVINQDFVPLQPFSSVSKDDTNELMFLTTTSAINLLVAQSSHHQELCNSTLQWENSTMHGHVAIANLRCEHGHNIRWTSSPYMANAHFLVNYRVFHGYITSGMIPSKYERFSEGANIGTMSQSYLDNLTKEFANIIKSLKNESSENAVELEIGMYPNLEEGITIMTDARHGCRKNAKDCDIVCIGEKTHQVLHSIHVTKRDDPCSQRHETFGTRRMYDDFERQNVSIGTHVHDCNGAVNCLVRDTQIFTDNQNDSWHACIALKKQIQNVASGPKYKHGQSWHAQLEDKPEAIRKFAYTAMKNCGENAETLRYMLANMTEHFQNNHQNCFDQSRCRLDPNYEPSTIVVRNDVAIRLLNDTIKKSTIYKNAHNYTKALSTAYVESFNNTLNMFQDKRIYFQDIQYEMRTNLAVLYWNENVDRAYTSLFESEAPDIPFKHPKKVLTKPTYSFRENIWEKLIESVYT